MVMMVVVVVVEVYGVMWSMQEREEWEGGREGEVDGMRMRRRVVSSAAQSWILQSLEGKGGEERR